MLRDTDYAEEIVTTAIGDIRLERLFVKSEGQEEVRLSWWPGGNLAPRPVDIPESMLIELLANGVKSGVLTPAFLARLIASVAA